MRESKEPCYLSFVIGTLIEDCLYIRDWPTNRETPEQNEILICEKIREHNIQELTIESNAAQSEFIRNVEDRLSNEGYFITINPLNNTANKDRRIQGMHGTVIKKVFFRDDWEDKYPVPMGQLITYPYSKFKDAPDALAGIIQTVQTGTAIDVRYI